MFLFGEGEESTEGGEEEPLHGRIFENIIGESREFEGQEKEKHHTEGELERAPFASFAIFFDEE